MTLVWTYFGRNQQTWTPFGHHLDTFWALFGHIAGMDMFWTCFGHILDTFWTLSQFLCPKCVHPHIVQESLVLPTSPRELARISMIKEKRHSVMVWQVVAHHSTELLWTFWGHFSISQQLLFRHKCWAETAHFCINNYSKSGKTIRSLFRSDTSPGLRVTGKPFTDRAA